MPPVPDIPAACEQTPCIACGYELAGLLADGLCPECGTPIARSMHDRLLRYEPIDWLVKAVGGIGTWRGAVLLVLLAPFGGLLALAIMLGATSLAAKPEHFEELWGVFWFALLAVLAIAVALYSWGVWQVTRPKFGGQSVLGTVRIPARALGVAAAPLWGALAPTAHFATDPLLTVGVSLFVVIVLGAHAWTWSMACAALERQVIGLSASVRRRFKFARRDGAVLVLLGLLGVLWDGAYGSFAVFYFYLWTIIWPVSDVLTEMELELRRARELQAGASSETDATG